MCRTVFRRRLSHARFVEEPVGVRTERVPDDARSTTQSFDLELFDLDLRFH